MSIFASIDDELFLSDSGRHRVAGRQWDAGQVVEYVGVLPLPEKSDHHVYMSIQGRVSNVDDIAHGMRRRVLQICHAAELINSAIEMIDVYSLVGGLERCRHSGSRNLGVPLPECPARPDRRYCGNRVVDIDHPERVAGEVRGVISKFLPVTPARVNDWLPPQRSFYRVEISVGE